MASPTPPSSMRAWQYSSTKGGLEKNLKLNTKVPLPKPKSDQHLVQVLATCLNPVDHKPVEVPLVGQLLVSKPAVPCLDFAGRIVAPAAGSGLEPGQLIFGVTGSSVFAGGGLAEYAVVEPPNSCPAPTGVAPKDAATLGVAALTAYQSIVPKVKEGDRVFINGGSGGTGVFGIQIGKLVGCHITATCSTPNVELCKSLGADEVIDYRTQNVLEALKSSATRARPFDLVIDNVSADFNLAWRNHEYMKPKGKYVMVAGVPSVRFAWGSLKLRLWPSFLGGAGNKIEGFFPKPKREDAEKMAQWVQEGKMKAVFDQTFAFENAVAAFERIKTGRARGKIVVDVALEKEQG